MCAICTRPASPRPIFANKKAYWPYKSQTHALHPAGHNQRKPRASPNPRHQRPRLQPNHRRRLHRRAHPHNPRKRRPLCPKGNANRQHPQRPTRQVAARHRSADLPGQADGSHKPRAACTKPRASVSEPLRVLRVLRLLTAPAAPRAARSALHQAKSERQRAPPRCSEISALLRDLRAHAAPPSKHTHLESPCRRAAAPSKPNFHHLHYDTTLPAIRAIRIIRVPDCFTRPAIRAPAACAAPHKFAIFRLFWNLSAPPFTKILHFYFATAFIFTNFAADLFITHI